MNGHHSTGDMRLPGWFGASPPFLAAAAVCLIAALVSVIVAVVAFGKPSTERVFEETGRYEQSMAFNYIVSVEPSTLYPTGVVGPIQAPPGPITGEVAPPPLYARLTQTMELGYRYEASGEGLSDVRGTSQATLVVSANGKGGWSTNQALSSPAPFDGGIATGNAVLDFTSIQALISAVEKETEFKPQSYNVNVVVDVDMQGDAQGQPVNGHYSQTFAIEMAGTSIRPDGSLVRSEPKALGTDVTRDRDLSLGTLSLPVRTARVVFPSLAAVCGVLLAVSIYAIVRSLGDDARRRISTRYGTRFVSVAEASFGGSEVVQMTSLDDLAVLAQRDGRIIFNKSAPAGDLYFLSEGPITYEYFESSRESERR